jgi:putative lipoprotein
MPKKIVILFIALSAWAFAGCKPAGLGTLTGTVNKLDRMALTPDHVVKVQLADISKADAPAEVLNEQTLQNPGQVPIPYALTYDPKNIIDNHTYSVSARIYDGSGKLVYISTTVIPVITRGSPVKDVEIMVQPVP